MSFCGRSITLVRRLYKYRLRFLDEGQETFFGGDLLIAFVLQVRPRSNAFGSAAPGNDTDREGDGDERRGSIK